MRVSLLKSAVAISLLTGLAVACLAETVPFYWLDYAPQPAATESASAGHYRNPIFAGFYPDPSICQVGSEYYLINSSFAYFPGIPIFHSRDLVNWQQLGHVIDRPSQLPYAGLGVSRGIFAPALSHFADTFYVVCTMVDAGGNFVVTAKNPAGPWSDPVFLGFEGIDPALFFDEDGRAWMVNNGAPEGTPLYDGHRAIWIQEFDPAAKKMIGPRQVLVNGGVSIAQKPVWIEGPHIFRREGWYYLCCAEGGTSLNHSQVVFRSRAVTGPYEPWNQNPILTQRGLPLNVPGEVTSTGHAQLFVGPDKKWWSVFLGVRPYEGRFSVMGRETFLLPITWTKDGWPLILNPGQRVPLGGEGPRGGVVAGAGGRFDSGRGWRDDFTAPVLSPSWIMLRTPRENWWKLGGATGHLQLTPRTELLSGSGNPSYLGRRVQDAHFTVSTAVGVPTEPGISAGLVVFQNETHHYFLAVRQKAGGAAIYLEKHNGAAAEVVAQAALPANRTVRLRISVTDGTCSFGYAADTGDWQSLADSADARLLTTEVAGGFVGATTGVYARIDP